MRNRIVNGIIRVFVYHLITKWIYRFFYKGGGILVLLFLGFLASLFLTGCGGSGGGASQGSPDTSTPTLPSPPSAGEAKFYYFQTDSSNLLTTTTMNGISNEFGLNVRDVNNRVLDIGIYQPECFVGSIEYDYNLIMIDGSSTSPNRYGARLGSSSITLLTLTEGSTTTYTKSSTTLSGSCTNGVYTLTGGVLISNGKTLLYRTTSGDLYFGIKKTLLLTDKSLLPLKKFYQYCQQDTTAVSYQNSLNTWIGNAGMEYTDPSALSFDSAFGFSPNYVMKYMCASSRNSNYLIMNNQFSKIWDGSSARTPFYGVTAIIGGKTLFLSSMVYKNCTAGDLYSFSGEFVCDPVGSGAVNFFIEQ